jgi:hypothetical protein
LLAARRAAGIEGIARREQFLVEAHCLEKHCERSSKESRGGRLTRLRHAHQPGPSVHHLGGRNLRPPSRRGAPTVNQPEIGEFTDAPRSGELRSWPS